MPTLQRPDGCRLYLEVYGPGDPASGEPPFPLLLLEGLGGDIPGWRRNLPRLAASRPVVAFDHRGNGRSDDPDEPAPMATFVADAVAVLDEVGTAAAHAYGQSFGGMIAQELALSHPHRVRSLVLAATHPGRAHAVRDPAAPKVPKDRPHLALYSEWFAREHPEQVRADLLAGSRRPQPRHAGRRQWDAMQAWDAFDRLSEIACPTLVLHGTEDRLVAVANARLLTERIPGAELVLIEGAGHVYHSERPEEADRAVLDFLDRVEAGR